MEWTAFYALCHFVVDLLCANAAFSRGPGEAFGFLLYNFFAFAVQMPLGLIADRVGRGKWFAFGGMALVALCCCLPQLGLAGMCLLGLGNALFHVGGGLDVMNLYPDRAAPLGIFVSPGALGLFMGTLWGTQGHGRWSVLLVILPALWAVRLQKSCQDDAPGSGPVTFPRFSFLPWAALLFLVVVLRSYGGMAAAFDWKTGLWSWVAVAAVVLGKTLGGFAADRLGCVRTSLLSLGLAVVLFFFGGRAFWGVLALLAFNMSMPITLFALARAMPGCKGFSFGLLTFGLFLGFLPVYFGTGAIGGKEMAVVSLVSLVLLIPGVWKCLHRDADCHVGSASSQ